MDFLEILRHQLVFNSQLKEKWPNKLLKKKYLFLAFTQHLVPTSFSGVTVGELCHNPMNWGEKKKKRTGTIWNVGSRITWYITNTFNNSKITMSCINITLLVKLHHWQEFPHFPLKLNYCGIRSFIRKLTKTHIDVTD